MWCLFIYDLFYRRIIVLKKTRNIRWNADGWIREASGVLCDRKILIKLNGKFDKTVVSAAMVYRSEYLAIGRKIHYEYMCVRQENVKMDEWSN